MKRSGLKTELTLQAKDRIYKKKIRISCFMWNQVRDLTARLRGDLSLESTIEIEQEMRKMFEVVSK